MTDPGGSKTYGSTTLPLTRGEDKERLAVREWAPYYQYLTLSFSKFGTDPDPDQTFEENLYPDPPPKLGPVNN
jgi:hypothetical protein